MLRKRIFLGGADLRRREAGACKVTSGPMKCDRLVYGLCSLWAQNGRRCHRTRWLSIVAWLPKSRQS